MLLLALLAVAGATCCLLSHLRHDEMTKKEPPGAAEEQKRPQGAKQERHAARTSCRRERKDASLQAAKAVRSRRLGQERRGESCEQRREAVERVKMRRVEQYQKLEAAILHGISVVVDLTFVETQQSTERQSVFKQLGCFYGYLKQCPLDALLSLRVASCADSPEASALCRQHGLTSWKIWRHDEPVECIYDPAKLVYLSPDAGEVLEQLDPSSIYVVGAIADRTVRKGETATKAKSKGLRAVRLPVREYLTGAWTHVLNIDAVLVALNELANHGDWPRALARAVPKRIATGRRAKKSAS